MPVNVAATQFSCPQRRSANGLEVKSPADDGTAPLADGRGQDYPVITADGRWSNCDLYISVPVAWYTADVQFRIYARTGNARALIAEATVQGADLQAFPPVSEALPIVTWYGLALRIRGTPCEAFEIVARSATSVSNGNASIELWGTESTPEEVGNRASQGVRDQAAPARASLGMVWTGTEWVPSASSSSGATIVAGQTTPGDAMANPTNAVPSASYLLAWDPIASQWQRVEVRDASDGMDPNFTPGVTTLSILAGLRQPGGNAYDRVRVVATNADNLAGFGNGAIAAGSFLLGWDGATWDRVTVSSASSDISPAQALDANGLTHGWVGGAWRRIDSLVPASGNHAGGNTLSSTSYCLFYSPSAANFRAPRLDPNDSLKVISQPPSATDTASASSFTSQGTISAGVKIGAARLLAIDVDNETAGTLYFMVFNKVSAPVLADVPLFQWPVRAGASLVRDRAYFGDEGRLLSAGLAWGWSSTKGTYTAAGAFTGTVNGEYV